MRLGILRDKRYVRSAQHNRYAATAEVICQLICPFRGASDDRHADQVGSQVEIDILNAFIHDLDFHIKFWRNICRESSESERSIAEVLFEDASAMSIQGALGRNQNKFHYGKPPIPTFYFQHIRIGFVPRNTHMTISNAEEVIAAPTIPFQISFREIQIPIFTDCQIFFKTYPTKVYPLLLTSTSSWHIFNKPLEKGYYSCYDG